MQRSPLKGPLIIICALLCLRLNAAPSIPDVKVVNEFAVDGNLSQYLKGETLLVMGFYHCKHMCNYIVRDLSRNLAQFKQHPKVVYFGIDEKEGPRDAIHLKKRIIGPLKQNWTFLVAEKNSIEQVVQALKFEMSRDPVTDVITHEMGIYWTKDGVVLKKLDVLEIQEADLLAQRPLHQSLSAIKRFCTAFDPSRSKYGPEVLRFLSLASVVFLAALAYGLFKLRRRPHV